MTLIESAEFHNEFEKVFGKEPRIEANRRVWQDRYQACRHFWHAGANFHEKELILAKMSGIQKVDK